MRRKNNFGFFGVLYYHYTKPLTNQNGGKTMKTATIVLTLLLAVFSAFDASTADNGSYRMEKDHSKICMVNNRYMGSEQIPVKVEGKTYYGCCEGCKKTLTNEKSARMSNDPVSGKEVDKADAVIGVDPTGSVLYFENEKNFDKYVKSRK